MSIPRGLSRASHAKSLLPNFFLPSAGKEGPVKRRRVRLWPSILIGLVLALIAVAFSRVLQTREEEQIQRMTRQALIHIDQEIESELEARIHALERISERWAVNGVPT